jgi:diketogulonate reductase-like aldo/keto reductase
MSIKNHDDDTIAYCQSKGIVYEAYGTMRGCPFTDPDVLAIAKEHNVSASQVCLRWVLERGCISAAGTGSSPSTVVEYVVPAPPRPALAVAVFFVHSCVVGRVLFDTLRVRV